MEKIKTNYTAADIENIDSETLAGMLNSLGKDIEQTKIISDYNLQVLGKASACIRAVRAVLDMYDG